MCAYVTDYDQGASVLYVSLMMTAGGAGVETSDF